jgi:RND family efflux transporter MFP subunit
MGRHVRTASLLAAVSATVAGVVFAALPRGAPATATRADPFASDLPLESLVVREEPAYEVVDVLVGKVVSPEGGPLGFLRSGNLEWVASVGDRFRVGDPLARLDASELRIQRETAAANAARAHAQGRALEARLALASRTLERHTALLELSNISRARHEETFFDVQALRSERDAAKHLERAAAEELLQIDKQIDDSVLRAPYGGVVVGRSASVGSVVQATTPVLEYLGMDRLEVHAGVSARVADRLVPNQIYSVEIGGAEWELRLVTVVPKLDADSRTYRAILAPAAAPLDARSGTIARLRVPSTVPDRGFWLPLEALVESHRGLWSVYALRASDEARANGRSGAVVEVRTVEVLYSDGRRAYVRGALADRERVIASHLARVVPGQRVLVDTP